ncbi:MAG: hypothetical protein HKP61_17795 [Dactylosporangium sp.]|nr:hypothetical protein [Dactylosporangium sp.]NNJ62751.1 hypothetical protein [Dactylosporangium sp.]
MTAPVVTCASCGGAPTRLSSCSSCHQHGRRRAQQVLTVANLDTGAVASISVTPGSTTPRPAPDGTWWIDLTALVNDLASAVGAESVFDTSGPDQPIDPDEILGIALPPGWRPSAPAATRAAAEAAAIATDTGRSWRVYLGHSVPWPEPEPDRLLQRLCGLADLLRIDLIVEARRQGNSATGGPGLTWSIRFGLPGAGTPEEPWGIHGSVADAVARTSPAIAFRDITRCVAGARAPAHWVTPPRDQNAPLPVVHVETVEDAVVRDCRVDPSVSDTIGAQAIWREGRWHHTTVRRIGPVTARGHEPPPPSWLGQPIPYTTCPEHDCAASLHRSPPEDRPNHEPGPSHVAAACRRCGGTGLLYHGAVVTITDLDGRVDHHNWEAEPGKFGQIITPAASRQPVALMPEPFRLTDLTGAYGVRPADLTDLSTGQIADHALRFGYTVIPNNGPADLVRTYLQRVGQGRSGARIFIHAAAPDLPPLAHVVRLAERLGLSLNMTVEAYPRHPDDPTALHGEWWTIDLTPPSRNIMTVLRPLYPSLQHALRICLNSLDRSIDRATPADPTTPIPCPGAAGDAAGVPGALGVADQANDDAELPQLISRIASGAPGLPVLIRRDPGEWRVYRSTELGSVPVRVASNARLADAAASLGIGSDLPGADTQAGCP